MWKEPNRPKHEISQSYNDGIVTIYSVGNIAKPGYQPKEGLEKKACLRYEEMRLGISRIYLSKQSQVEIERVLRVQEIKIISPQDVAITEDGHQYRIDTVQKAKEVFPPSTDIGLTRVTQRYEVIT